MKKHLLLFLLLPFLAFAAADWITVKLDEQVSIHFPEQPKVKDSNGNPLWAADVDSTARCVAMIIDFEKMGLDSATLYAELNKEGMFEQFRNGFMGKLEGATLVSEKQSTAEGRYVFDFTVDLEKKLSGFNRLYNRNIFIGTKMYSLTFYEIKGKPRDAWRNKYFNSIRKG